MNPSELFQAPIVMQRYRDAYRVANTIVRMGQVIKKLGGVLATVVLAVVWLTFAEITRSYLASAIMSIPAAGIVGLLFWVMGVLVSCQGQLLLASLDGAVNSSPFLSDEGRAAVMSLRSK